MIGLRLSAWWSAWKYVAILMLLLIVSVLINLQQWKARAVAKSEARAETMQDALKVTAGLARGNLRDGRELMRDIAVVADRGRTTRVVYRNAAVKAPLPAVCAPGKARMDAVNSGADK